MQRRQYTVLAPTTGGSVWIERVRARPRLQSSYAALKGDFRPLSLSSHYHDFVSGPLAAHGLADGAHELLLTDDIDSGRSWELPVLIAHLLANADRLVPPEATTGDTSGTEQATIIWATGAVDPELNPQSGDYAVARKCALAEPMFTAWKEAGRSVHLITPPDMPESDRETVRKVVRDFEFTLHEVPDLAAVQDVFGLVEPVATTVSDRPPPNIRNVTPDWFKPRYAAALAALLAVIGGAYWLSNGKKPSVASTDAVRKDTQTAGKGMSDTIALVRLGARDRSDCIERIMQTQPMELTNVAISDGAFRISSGDGLCGLRFINQTASALRVRMTGDLINAAIQGNDALFQGVALAANDKMDLIFSSRPDGLKADLQLENESISPLGIPVIIAASSAAE